MSNQYQVVAHRSDLAIYYGWEYGIRYARELMKRAKEQGQVRPGFYRVKPLDAPDNRKVKTKYYNEGLARRMSEIVAGHRARMTNKLGCGINVYVEQI